MREEEAGTICPSCEQVIPLERFDLHLEGLDGAHPECPRTDLVEVAERAREVERQEEARRRRAVWERPWSRAWPGVTAARSSRME
jgi:hypothetical protein